MERATRVTAERAFKVMVAAARSAGVDTTEWEFGRPYGLLWVITSHTRTGRRAISPYWETFRQAQDGMDAMRMAFELVGVK